MSKKNRKKNIISFKPSISSKFEKETKGDIKSNIENPNLSSNTNENISVSLSLTPYDIFIKCITRANNLIDINSKTLSVEEITDQHYNDCYRASIVLVISALDAFIRTIIINKTKECLADPSKKIPEKLSKYLQSIITNDRLLEVARGDGLIEEFEKLMLNDFETKSFQGENKIEEHIKMIGFDNIFKAVADKCNISESNLRKDINIFTKRRHYIAHTGDYNLNQSPQTENDINREFAELCIKTISEFVKNINLIIK